jgi:hypothetical protein
VALLARRIPGLDPHAADVIAGEVGDLPLALEQTAAYLEQTGMPAQRWLARFRTHRAQLLAKGDDLAYRGTVDTAWTLALHRLATDAPAAAQLLALASHCGPDPIPLALVADHPDLLDCPLADQVATGNVDDVVGAVLAYSLARRRGDSLQLHRLVQAVIRAHQPSAQARKIAGTVRALLAAHIPGNPEDPALWPQWAALAPHVLAAPALHPDDLTVDIGSAAHQLLLNTAYYLDARGGGQAAGTLGQSLHTRWAGTLGPDHPHSLAAAHTAAIGHRARGDHRAALQLDEDTVARRRRVLGEDHPDTLSSANNLSVDLTSLGEHQASRDVAEDTVARRRRVLGEDHPDTLTSANNLAVGLAALGDVAAARALWVDTLARRRRVLGDDHPHTLTSANNLAGALRELGQHQGARQLDEDTLARRRRVLGDDHPDTLQSANNLAGDLYLAGDFQAARRLDEDTLARRRRVLGDGHPDTLGSANNLAILLRALGEREAAQDLEGEIRPRRGEPSL